MYCNFAFVTLAVMFGNGFVSAQQIPPSTTAGELWNPWTWFWPYAIASAEAYKDYYEKSQKATNELYQQIYKTNAFPWITGKWGEPQTNPGEDSKQNQPGGGSEQSNPTEGGDQTNPTENAAESDPSNDQTNPTENAAESNPSNDQTNPTENAAESDSSNDQSNTDETGQTEQPSDAQVQGSDTADGEVAGGV